MKRKNRKNKDVKNFTTGCIIGGACKILTGIVLGNAAPVVEVAKAAVSCGAWSVVIDRVGGKLLNKLEKKTKEVEAEMKAYNVA